jgi:predicted NBD/HSP70 family sugar kinase
MYHIIQEKNRYSERDRQKTLIYQAIAANPKTSRTAIAELLRIRANSVSDLVQELVDAGLVGEESGESRGRRGRPEIYLTLNTNRFVGISLYSEDRILIGSLVNLAEETLAEVTVPIPFQADNRGYLRSLYKLVEDLKKSVPEGAELLGAGISTIGTVDSENKIWIEATRWPHIKNVDFNKVEKTIGIPVLLKRWLDTELEYQLLRDPSYREGNTLLFHWGAGIGASFSHNGNVLYSRFGKFADAGHTVVDPGSNRHCRCGLIGCLEAHASIWALLPAFHKKHPEARESIHDVEEVLKDPVVLEDPDVQEAIRLVGVNLANLFKTLLPQRIFFMGPFLKSPTIYAEVKARLEASFYRHIRGAVHIEVIGDQLRFCKIANVKPFFLERLREALKAKNQQPTISNHI